MVQLLFTHDVQNDRSNQLKIKNVIRVVKNRPRGTFCPT